MADTLTQDLGFTTPVANVTDAPDPEPAPAAPPAPVEAQLPPGHARYKLVAVPEGMAEEIWHRAVGAIKKGEHLVLSLVHADELKAAGHTLEEVN